MYRAYWTNDNGERNPLAVGRESGAVRHTIGSDYAVPSFAFMERIRKNPNYYPSNPGMIRLHISDKWLRMVEA